MNKSHLAIIAISPIIGMFVVMFWRGDKAINEDRLVAGLTWISLAVAWIIGWAWFAFTVI